MEEKNQTEQDRTTSGLSNGTFRSRHCSGILKSEKKSDRFLD